MWHTDVENSPIDIELNKLFSQRDDKDHHLIAGINCLAKKYGETVYGEALFHLTGKRFSDELSLHYWQQILDHRLTLFHPEFTAATLRPALLDYLNRVVGEIVDPRIIDAEYLINIKRTSQTDGLTGLYCQTFFKHYLGKILANTRRGSSASFAVLFFDLDTFKQYNDRCGHLCGDEALRRTAEIIKSCLREGDVAARYGGEEFAVYLPHANRKSAQIVAERIRRAVEQEAFPREELIDRRRLTISGGISIYPEDGNSITALLEVADQNLYRAKVRRNTIFSHHTDLRRSLRRKVTSLVEYSRNKKEFRTGLSHDINEYGIALGCSDVIQPGEVLSLRMYRPYWPKDLYAQGVVRQIRCIKNLYHIGVEFDQVLPKDAASPSFSTIETDSD